MLDDKERRDRLAFAIRAAMGKRSAQAIAEAMSPHRSKETVARWARGETVPSALDIAPLATALGVRVEFLVEPPAVPSYPIEDYLIPEDVARGQEDLGHGAAAAAREDLEREVAERRAAADKRADARRRQPA